MPEFTDTDLTFSNEDSTNKVIASSKVGKADSGPGLGDGDDGGVWVVSARV